MRALSFIALLAFAAACPAAPQLGDKPAKWEYAQVTFRNIPARPAGIDGDGNQVEAVPASMSIRWISVDGEVEVKSWADLAEKLKAAKFKKDGSAELQRIQLLNHLGGEGWELMDQSASTTSTSTGFLGPAGPGGRGPATRTTTTSGTWMLKRRVP